jgi:hypothetical protein
VNESSSSVVKQTKIFSLDLFSKVSSQEDIHDHETSDCVEIYHGYFELSTDVTRQFFSCCKLLLLEFGVFTHVHKHKFDSQNAATETAVSRILDLSHILQIF